MNNRLNQTARWFPVLVLMISLSALDTTATAQNFWSGSDLTYASSASNSTWGSDRWMVSSTNNKQWKLGVEGTNTQTGVFINRVVPGSPAARIGLVPTNQIVSVAGEQVGLVNGRVIDLNDALNRHASSTGVVKILAYGGTVGEMKTLNVQLDAAQLPLSGTVLVTPGNLPSDAVLTVQLINTSRPQYVVRNGEISIRPPVYSNGVIPFTLNYDPSYIFPSDNYQVRAHITSAGRTIYDALQPPFVLTRGNPSNVAVKLSSVSYGSTVASAPNNSVILTAGYANYDAVNQKVTLCYREYLGRNPSAIELAAWHQVPDIDYRLSRLPLELMASQEYYARMGSNNLVWVRTVFGNVIGHTPSALELDKWMGRFAELRYSRSAVLDQMQSVANSR